MTDIEAGSVAAGFAAGILSAPQLEKLVEAGVVEPSSPIAKDQIQPASIDLRLGRRVWRIQASFLPGADVPVEDKLSAIAMHELDIAEGAVLEKGCVYIAEIEEGLNLPDDVTGFANPKSSTGRLDVFTRMITDGAMEFETARPGYRGRIYTEISPRTFSVVVRRGSRLSQLRFRKGNPRIDDEAMKDLQRKVGLVHGDGLGDLDIRDGVPLSVDLSGEVSPSMPELVGWRARKHAGAIDVDRPKTLPVAPFWESVTRRDLTGGGLILNPDEFYILASREFVTVPPDHAAEMTAYDTRVGEFRAHYAGFFDPGFGMPTLGAGKTRAVLEVRSHDVPFLVEEGQTVCRLVYEPLSEVPGTLYGDGGSGSNYQAQGLQLAKHFLPPEDMDNG